MPIYECDPWRRQYFAKAHCPSDVHIPTDDIDGYKFNPQHRWIYNKLLVARSQGLECGLHDTAPTRFPVFCKPVTNLKGMGAGTCVLNGPSDFREKCNPHDFWMKLLMGEHVSTDWAVVRGEAAWSRHALGIPGLAGTFDYWVIEARQRQRLEKYCSDWIKSNLSGYSGMINIETIGGRIIEAHLRFADQWPDLYGAEWLDAVVRLYQHGEWDYAEAQRTDGYSVALFGPHGRPYNYPTPEHLASYEATPGICSVQITFLEGRPAHEHVMPPGGFRLAVINSLSLEAGMRLRSTMARDFGVSEVPAPDKPAYNTACVAAEPGSMYR